ncbi:MAG: hypothetical protein AAF518_01600 [Spirochaetota bacterium]
MGNWIAFLVSFAFASTGILLSFTAKSSVDRNNIFSFTLFFGFCTAVLGYFIFQKYLEDKRNAIPITDVQLSSTVLRMNKGKVFFVSTLSTLCFALIAYLATFNPIFTYVCYGISALAALMLVGLAVGFVANDEVHFQAEGIHFRARTITFFLEWSNIYSVDLVEWNSNPFLLFQVLSQENVLRDLGEKQQKKLAKIMAWNQGFFNAPLTLQPAVYGVSPVLLAKLIQKYIEFPETRQELKLNKPALPG